MVKCTINGHEVEVSEGSTIIEAFKKMSEDIAHYCWHPGLSVAGVCRLCMVDIEGMNRPQIACNTVVREGMVITNQSESIKETVRWGMDFHLINHPLDCPICDQAGECGLQEQYMKFGNYDPEMNQQKVKKRKVVSLGEKVVLDSERCILCSRCVRFTDEVSKTNELGIFHRGDKSEVGTFKDKPLNNDYSLNTVDICPVGALTSKDFRFRQRVWYLKNGDTVCNGCSTGCNVKTYYNEDGLFRVKPVENQKVNGYWMCDEGRDFYTFVNKENRLTSGYQFTGSNWEVKDPGRIMKNLNEELFEKIKQNPKSVGIVLTSQYTTEEYESVFTTFKGLGVEDFYHWFNCESTKDEFDGLLKRGDKNPNTKGLLDIASKNQELKSIKDLEVGLESGQVETLFVLSPENILHYPNFEKNYSLFSKAKNFVWFGAHKLDFYENSNSKNTFLVPVKSFVEKSGSFTNFSGEVQQFKPVLTVVSGALTMSEAMTLFRGEELNFSIRGQEISGLKYNHFTTERGKL